MKQVQKGKIKAALFDMDGLLLDTERMSLQAWEEAAQNLGMSVDQSVFVNLIGFRWEDCLHKLTEQLGESDQLAQLAWQAQAIYQQKVQNDTIPLKAGVLDLLKHLQQQELPLAVATSTRREVAEYKLERTGLRSYFSAVAGGNEVERGKPAPDLYQLAAGRLDIAPGECMAFEDSGPGIRAAYAAGTLPVLIPDLRLPEDVVREGLVFAVIESADQAITLFFSENSP